MSKNDSNLIHGVGELNCLDHKHNPGNCGILKAIKPLFGKSENVYLKRVDIIRVFMLVVFVFILSVITLSGLAQAILVPVLGFLIVLVVLVQIYCFRRTEALLNGLLEQRSGDYKQIEALFSLFSVLKIDTPLPLMRGWAICPDFANLVVSLIHQFRPKLIFETGSGVSTLIAAYCLKQNGRGQVISLEHDEEFAKVTRTRLQEHGLEKYACVIHTPLAEVMLGGRKCRWYDLSSLDEKNLKIDFLIVDGPPQESGPLARYPVLPLLCDYLSDRAVILLDDYIKEDQKKIVELWMQEFNQFTTEAIDTEKGAFVMYKNKGGIQ